MAKILVIDDSAADRMLTTHALEQMGHFVATETSGSAALRRLAGSRFDLIILDIFMEGMDGLEFLRAKVGVTEAPILAISGGGSVFAIDFLEVATSLGADATLYKPFASAELGNAVASLLERRPPPPPPPSMPPTAGS